MDCFIYQLTPESIDLDDIYAMVDTDIIRSDIQTYSLMHLRNFEYYVVGKLLDKYNGRVKYFDYIFETDGYFLGNIEDGEWVEFGVGKFDL